MVNVLFTLTLRSGAEMKKVLLSGLLSLCCSSYANAHDLPECARADAGVGEIVTSVLKKSDFQNLYGPDWELLDGGLVGKVELLAYLPPEMSDGSGNVYLPDARGKFLRMSNNGLNDETSDPSKDRYLGSYQSDNFKEHNHKAAYTNFKGTPEHTDRSTDEWGKISGWRNTTATGGLETRPKNVLVNFYIRTTKTDQSCK